MNGLKAKPLKAAVALELASIAVIYASYKKFYGEDVAACFITGLEAGLGLSFGVIKKYGGNSSSAKKTVAEIFLMEIALQYKDIDAGLECLL